LEAFENTQNHQDIPWKSLEKKASDLEKLGKKPWRLGDGAFR